MLTELKKKAEERLGSSVDGKYRLERVLGVGGMGSVYAATHRFTDRKVALKILHPRLAKGANAERFLREAKAAAAIDHHGLADVLDAGKAKDGTLYVAFEMLTGQDFGVCVKTGKVTAAVVTDVAMHILEALDVVHRNGFVHRDIKPANIFVVGDLEGEFRAKLLDFGVMRRMNPDNRPGARSVTRAGAVVGTPYYMSPEQMCGEAVDGRADLWALGIVMYYALVGKLPFRQRNFVSLLSDMMKKGPPPIRDVNNRVSSELAMVVERSLSPQIQDRYATAQDMMLALQVCQQNQPTEKPDTLRIEVVSPTVDLLPSKPSSVELEPESRWESALEAIEGETQAIESQTREVSAAPSTSPSTGGWLSRWRKKKP